MRTLEIYHNEFGQARPKAQASNGFEFNFYFEKISKSLQSKLYGFNGKIELTVAECKELINAR